MPLCGSYHCGCAIVSVPATAGAINGDLPTIDVAGNGTTASPWNITLNDQWVTAVAAVTPWVLVGAGTPASAVTAPVGTIYLRTNGGASTTLYVKESGVGNTGWVAK